MLAYTSFISDDVQKSYRVEKLVLHHLTFLLIMVPNAILFHILLPYRSLIFAIVMKECLEPINTY